MNCSEKYFYFSRVRSTSVSVDIFTIRYIFGKRKVNFLVVFVRFGSFSVFIENNDGVSP